MCECVPPRLHGQASFAGSPLRQGVSQCWISHSCTVCSGLITLHFTLLLLSVYHSAVCGVFVCISLFVCVSDVYVVLVCLSDVCEFYECVLVCVLMCMWYVSVS